MGSYTGGPVTQTDTVVRATNAAAARVGLIVTLTRS
jgi:hypothetical protein